MFTVVYDTIENGLQIMRFDNYDDAIRYSKCNSVFNELYGIVCTNFEDAFIKSLEALGR